MSNTVPDPEHPLGKLFEANRNWAADTKTDDPGFFDKLASQQTPDYLWIGCSDSRVPANQITGLEPGEVIVHRNIANVVVHSDFNCLSVLEYAVQVLKVKHIIVCGHYGCGGVEAALRDNHLGLIDNWLRHIRDVREKHESVLASMENEEQERAKLCELNVVEQVNNVCHTTIVQQAWQEEGRVLTVHGWIYSLKDGLLKDLSTSISGQDGLCDIYRLVAGDV